MIYKNNVMGRGYFVFLIVCTHIKLVNHTGEQFILLVFNIITEQI